MRHTTTRHTKHGSDGGRSDGGRSDGGRSDGGRRLAALAALVAVAIVALAGCTSDDLGSTKHDDGTLEISDIRLTSVDSCERLVDVARARDRAVAAERQRYERQFDDVNGTTSGGGLVIDDAGMRSDKSGDEAATSAQGNGAATTMGPSPSRAPTATSGGVAAQGADGSSKAAPASAGSYGGTSSDPAASNPTVIAGTNNQEQGVDEGDLAKTDGRVLVTLSADSVLRVIVLDDTPAVDSALRLDDTTASDFGYSYGAGQGQLMLRPMPSGGREVVSVRSTWSPTDGTPVVDIARVDITDPAAPKVVERSKVLGELVATRMIGTTGRVVIRPTIGGPVVDPEPVPLPTIEPQLPTTTEPTTTTTAPSITTSTTTASTTTTGPATTLPGTDPSTTTTPNSISTVPGSAVPDSRTRKSTTTSAGKDGATHAESIPAAASALLPQRLLDNGTTEPLGSCNDVLSVPVTSPIDPAGGAVDFGTANGGIAADMVAPAPSGVTVLTVGTTLGDLAPVTVEGGVETVYAGTDALYTTSTTWSPTMGGSGDSVTAVHRFDLTGDHAARYTGSGLVPGRMLNQYSLSDRGGALRVVTTAQTMAPGSEVAGSDAVAPNGGRAAVMPSTTTAGRITVLRPGDHGTLREVGHLDDLGTGEEVKSVRFVEDRAYVVTFRQTDPLFAVDLSTDSPKLLGELKIPGFSEYLHPVGKDRLLGIGSDADPQTGRVTGFKASLFDVSDPTKPVELDQFTQANATSSLSQDPHAFTWDPVRSQAIVPVVVDPTSFGNGFDEGVINEGTGGPVPQTMPEAVPAIQIEPAPQCGPEIGCTSDAVPSTTVASPDEPTRSGSIAVGEPNGAPWSGAWIIGVDGNHLVRRATLAHDMGGRTDPILRSLVVDSSIWTVSDRTVGRTNATSPTSTAIVRF